MEILFFLSFIHYAYRSQYSFFFHYNARPIKAPASVDLFLSLLDFRPQVLGEVVVGVCVIRYKVTYVPRIQNNPISREEK